MAQRGPSPSSPPFEPLVDRPALSAYLHEHIPGGLTGDLQVERLMAGHSNETFFLSSGRDRWVLRRPPRGAFLPTAHDVIREYRVLNAVGDLAVRAPRPVLLCEDASVIGAPFYLMERVDGVVARDSVPPHWTEEDRRRAGDELVDALIELHSVDWVAAGLEGFGRPDGYLERQVRRWKGQLALTEPLTRHVEDLHRAGTWLQRHLPAPGAATIVHGDYKLDNVAFAAAGPARLVAIFDWEMSTLGDPLADLAWMLSFWKEEGEVSVVGLEEGIPTRLPGFATRSELTARYARLSDRPVGDLTFYLVLAVWKLAILLEGSYARHLAGVTDDPFFAQLEHGVPALASRAVGLIDEPGR
jgi:aminoglycoside phosphotransferase (APT) family kinase protein